ncbi:MAG: diacylglycerol kinase family protein [Chloroflexota bacterium]
MGEHQVGEPFVMPTNFFANRWYAFRMALEGVAYVLRTQKSAWIELAAVCVCVISGWWFQITNVEWAIIALVICLVFALEAVNTAVETVVDLVSPGIHPLAKIAKDTAAGALIFAVLGSLLVALFIFGPHLLKLIGF